MSSVSLDATLEKGLKLYVIAVELKGGINVGLMVRLAENFCVEEVRLVQCNLSEEDLRLAWIFSARARKYLEEKVKFFDDIESATRDLELVFATSAISSRDEGNLRRKAMSPEEAVELCISKGYKKVGIVFGREATGLTNEEIDKCDFLITIEANPSYNVLNVATAAAIILYVFYKHIHVSEGRCTNIAPRDLRLMLIKCFKDSLTCISGDENFIYKATKSFSNILNRAAPTLKETKVLLTALRRISKKLVKLSQKVA
ncbi:MAG: TrmH family RNA methyltransferase [Candidatus Geothermarchaeota archaeon]